MKDYADKEWLHEMAPAALPVVIALVLFAAFIGAALADWWTDGGIVAGAIDCVVVK